MAFPVPVPGLVIRYSYLWASEHARGQEEGVKDRPCAIVLATADDAGGPVVTVLPLSHTPPSDPVLAVEIPAAEIAATRRQAWWPIVQAMRRSPPSHGRAAPL